MSTNSHPHGEPKTFISFSGSSLDFEEAELRNLLTHPQVRDRDIAIVSIAGVYRKGKSFFMDYCLRFMYANFTSINRPSNEGSDQRSWMGDANESLRGFTWRSGSTRNTTGLIVWSDVFLHDPPNGPPMAILLVDTQGLFDTETTSDENAKILTLTTLVSSMTVLNIGGVIQEDQLQYLQYTAGFADLGAAQNSTAKPFQKLLFLIRDWSSVDDHDFGLQGGRDYLDKILQTKADGSDVLRSVREHLRGSFEELLCCLMPHPGKNVTSSRDFDGRWSSMDEDFREELKSLIENFLEPAAIARKKVNGVAVNGAQLFDIIKGYAQTFSSSAVVPKARSLYELAVEKFLHQLVEKCLRIFEENSKRSPESVAEMEGLLADGEGAAMESFALAKKMGGAEDEAKFREKLQSEIRARRAELSLIWTPHIEAVEETRRREAEAAKEREEAERREEESRRREEEVRRQIEENERAIRQQQEELRRQQALVEAEQRRQREMREEMERQREEERERQRRIEEEARRQREEQERRDRLLRVSIQEIGVHFDVPKPKCSVM